MSKRHYAAIAAILARVGNDELRADLARQFADFFEKDSSFFQRTKFMSACGVDLRRTPRT